MTYKKGRKWKYVLLLAVLIAVIRFTNFPFFVPIKIWCFNLCHYPKNCVCALRKNEELKLRIMALQTQLKQQENELKKLTYIKKFTTNRSPNVEKVLAYDQSMFGSDLFISLSNSHILIDSIVVSPYGLVGILHKIVNDIGVINTVTSSSLSIPVKTKYGSLFILQGTNKNELKSVVIKENTNKVHINDTVLTSGEGGIFPANIQVGTVIKIVENCIYVKPSTDFCNLEFVSIINPIKRYLK